MCGRADDGSTTGFNHGGGVALHILAVGVVDRNEVPGLSARIQVSLHGAKRLRVVVVGPVDAVGGAHLARQVGAGRAVENSDAVFFLCQVLHAGSHCGDADVENRPHAAVVPLPRNGQAGVGFVEVIRLQQLDWAVEHLAAEVVNGQLGRDDRTWPGQVGDKAGHVADDADLQRVAGLCPRTRRGRKRHSNGSVAEYGAAPRQWGRQQAGRPGSAAF